MNKEEMIRGALISLVEGRESIIYDEILIDIDLFFEKYSAIKELSSSQSAMIQSILLLGNKNEIKERLIEYQKRQLNRTSEKDKWLKEFKGQTAINYFYGMVDGLFQKYYPQIDKELEIRFGLQNDDKYNKMISQSLIRTFTDIFVTKLRLNSKEGR
jgi:hypothetical protein